ncbi:MAG: hypothetical protein L6R42_008818 [Xanthoria sp. 1 TBL-2021]|nr:MAG: hypothetical protein L6R42_008818 [Xanthoria sp. 1 TBL-2021]
MGLPPPRQDQAAASNQRSPPTDPPPTSTIKDLALPPLSSTYSFYVHKPSHTSGDLVLYNSIDKTLAYRVATRSHRPFSKFPNLYVYRGPQKPNSLARSSTTRQDNESIPGETPLATARLRRLSSTIPLAINNRSVELQRRTLGFYEYAIVWQSSRGNMSWKYGRLSLDMQLVDEKGTLLGGFDSNRGSDGRVGRLWVQDVEEEAVKHWVDEAVSVALTTLTGLLSRG